MLKAIDAFVKKDLLALNEKYIIPVFQRNYSWSTGQCKQLIDDILLTNKENYKHFIGNMICQRVVNNSTYVNENIIIDGQQRITTLFLFVKAIKDLSDDRDDIEQLNNFLFLNNNEKKLFLNIEDDKNYAELLKDNFEEINIQSPIYINYHYFKTTINDLLIKKTYVIKDFLRFISNLVFVKIHIDDNDDAQTIFERINSTGLDLSTADLVRNFLLMTNYNEKLYKDYWYKIEKLLGVSKVSEFIHCYLIFKVSRSVSEKKVYSVFKEYLSCNNWKKEDILYEMNEFSKYYSYLIQIKDFPNKKINKVIKDIHLMNQKTCFPFIFHLLNDYFLKVIDDDILLNCLEIIRNYIIRRILVDKALKNLNKFFSNLYEKIFTSKEFKQKYYDAMASYFIQVITTDRFPSDLEVTKALQINNLYANKTLCKFIFFELEHHNSNERIEDTNITIEHIMPQNLTEDWKKYLGENYRVTHELYLHTIGNLSLTGYNSNLSDFSFERKKEILKLKGSKFNFINKLVYECDVWNDKTILKRTNHLIECFLKIFPIKLPIEDILFKELLQPESTLENYGNLNGTGIAYFKIRGNNFYPKNWNDMLKITLEELYKENTEKMLGLALQNYSLKNNGTIDISLQKQKITRSKEIENTNIHYNYNYSATDIVNFIESLFDYFNYDKESFRFVTKKENKSKYD